MTEPARAVFLSYASQDAAAAQRDGGMTEIKPDPLLRSLHTDPRFQAMLVKMKLAQ
jgi:hypothetical protein